MWYRKQPIVVEAVQWTGDNEEEIATFAGTDIIWKYSAGDIKVPTIHTLEGDMIASKGDYIIRGVDGEFYPCKPDIFMRTYIPI